MEEEQVMYVPTILRLGPHYDMMIWWLYNFSQMKADKYLSHTYATNPADQQPDMRISWMENKF